MLWLNMSSKQVILFISLLGILSAYFYTIVRDVLYRTPPLPNLDVEPWWGPENENVEDTTIRPFTINVSDAILEDLKTRLSNTLPFQPPLEGVQQQYGINTNHLKNVIDFWKTEYNWREREKILNKYPQFTVSIQGLKIHYLHVKPTETRGLKVVPLLILHGWPSSVREFYDILPYLTTPQEGRDLVFEVVAPSLPGYAFSEPAVRPGLGPKDMAIVFKNFMKRLGFEKYYLQGGDWGGLIAHIIATLFPENVIGVHSNFCLVNTFLSNLKLILGAFFPSLIINKDMEDKIYPLSEKYVTLLEETGYMHIQATKPDTIGVALRDSPVGLAAYMLEKYPLWTNPEWKNLEDSGLTKKFKLVDLLDNVMIYWVTGCITTSMRLYAECFSKEYFALHMASIPTTVPSACARFSHELVYQPEAVLRDKFVNLVHIADYEGGHFAAAEEPEVLAKDLYMFVEKVENSIDNNINNL